MLALGRESIKVIGSYLSNHDLVCFSQISKEVWAIHSVVLIQRSWFRWPMVPSVTDCAILAKLVKNVHYDFRHGQSVALHEGIIACDFAIFYVPLICASFTLPHFPCSLQVLVLPTNHVSLSQICWPSSLTTLTLGREHNLPFSASDLPSSLTSLTLGRNFNSVITSWPSALVHVNFGHDFNHLLTIPFPSSLRFLELSQRFDFSIDVSYLENLELLYFSSSYRQSIVIGNLPSKLIKVRISFWHPQFWEILYSFSKYNLRWNYCQNSDLISIFMTKSRMHSARGTAYKKNEIPWLILNNFIKRKQILVAEGSNKKLKMS
jgi:hypothetical protein